MIKKGESRKEKFEDYDGFVEKFKPKKTTDDCFTPPRVYETLIDWISENIMPLDGVEIIRPFWPGGDYETADYPEGCVVIDNPPFSKLAAIRRFYHSRGIRYFLFAPALTMVNSAKELPATYIITRTSLEYENGVKVSTSFITNFDCSGIEIWVSGDLDRRLKAANKRPSANPLPAYEYPDCVASPAILRKIAQRGVDLCIPASQCQKVTSLQSQRSVGKAIFGGGWLLSERAAAERAAAERAAAERAAAERAAAVERIYWPLSPEEKEICRRLDED